MIRAKSPRSPAQQRRVFQTSPSRSRSVPNNNSSPSPSKSPKNIRKDLDNSQKSTQVDITCDFFINEISSRLFFQTQRKKELLSLAKTAKQTGNRYISSHTKSQVIAAQFWNALNSFYSQLTQELTKQFSQNQTTLSRNLSTLKETVDSIKSSKKFSDIQNRTIDLVNQGNSLDKNPDDITYLFNEFKQFQNDLVHDDAVSRQQALKYRLTSTISQVMTQLKNIKDISTFTAKCQNQFDGDHFALESEIPQSDNNKITSSPKTITPTKKIVSKSPIAKSRSPVGSVRPNTNSQDRIRTREENHTENDRNNHKVDSIKKSKPVVSMSTDLRNAKAAALEAKKTKPINEITKIQNQIARITKSKSSSSSGHNKFANHSPNQSNQGRAERKSIHFQTQFDALSDLHKQKTELDYNNLNLNALTESLINNLPEDSREIYQQNYDLRKQRNEYNEQLFSLSLKSLHINQITQRATLHPALSENDLDEMNDEYSIAFNENKKAQKKLDALQDELEKLEEKHDYLLHKKYNPNYVNNDSNRSIGGIKDELDDIKIDYRNRMSTLLAQQLSLQIEAVKQLKMNTEDSILKIRSKAKRELNSLESQKEAIDTEYEEIQELHSIATENNESYIQYGTETLEIDEAESILTDLNKQYGHLTKQADQLQIDATKNEEKIIENEKEKLNTVNHQLLKWISQIKKQTVDIDANLQSLMIQYNIMENKVIDPNFDINTSFIEAIKNAHQKNLDLKNQINEYNQAITDIDVDLGGDDDEKVSIDQRLQSIASKLKKL
ncbi:hypothetical protein TRFO_16769 [Tritrichomonas foetus]|uniref:Uncharacterized protein n=1 Tax=Tritrichomonas foetus TaxID=1144522 RepID=A0A1J4KTW2_9EUKA|nr:hypothetical protein TRFO_16769 [Tritrichomonas foetus]|eukprot:OHT13204.1 hypothetical protein TRFO_16769 [Tritrichomonas foetus]